MGSEQKDRSQPTRSTHLTLLFVCLISSTLVYTFVSTNLRPEGPPSNSDIGSVESAEEAQVADYGGCCRGIEHLELWGAAVKWGSEFKFNSSEECCEACRKMCSGNDGPCLCDSWVFCANRETCGPHFGECWLKKQKDSLAPEKQEASQRVIWTSGLIFGKGEIEGVIAKKYPEGIIGLETEYGTFRVKLYPDCAPYSVTYILELLALRHCAGCQFYRAESRGQSWDLEGNHINNAHYGPPFGMIQGTLGAQGSSFGTIPTEACSTIRRGSVAWVGSGPDFFISLANHHEWKNNYTVFGSVLPEDMEIAEKIARLPTKFDVWDNINVSVLQTPVPLHLKRLKMNQ